MTITFKSRKIKVKERLKRHKKFIMFPRKTSDTKISFLCTVVRKLENKGSGNYLYEDLIHGYFMWNHYEYQTIQDCITKKLMGKQDED